MIFYCNHCGAVLDSENDVCTVCGCRGGSFKIEEGPTLFHRKKHPDYKHIEPDHSMEETASEQLENEEDTKKAERRRKLIYDFGMLGLVVLIVIIFMVMTTVTTK